MLSTFAGATGRGQRLLGAALLACLLVLIGGSRAWAAPTWLPATDLSAPGKDASNAAVAMDAAGNTVAIWERQNVLNHDVQVSTRSAGGSFSAPIDLSLASTNPAVAMTPGGEAVAAWRHFDVNTGNYVIQASTRPPGGSFSAPVDVSASPTTASTQDIQAVVDAAGDTAIAWRQKDPGSLVDPNQFSVLASVQPAGGSFSTPAIVSPSPLTVGDDASSPRLAIDGAGDVTVAWEYTDSATPRESIQAATRPAGGSFTSPAPLSETSQDAFSPAVAMDSGGDATVVWTRFNGTNFIIQASARPAGGSFSMPVDLSATGENAGTPQIAMTPSGATTAVWSRSNGTNSIVQASTAAPGGAFSMPTDLSAVGQDAFDPEVATNAAGGATLVWHRSDGLNSIAQGSTRPAGGSYAPAVDLSAPGQDAAFPQVAMDGAGDATSVWNRSDGANSIVQAAGYDADAPELRNLSIPSSGMVGVPVSFSASPVDVWSIASTTFSFGDGATAAGTSATHTYSAKGTYPVTVTAVDAGGTPVSAGGTVAIAPSNRFSVGKLKLNRKKGSATLEVDVPGPGKLVLSGKVVKKTTKRAKRAGTVKLPITPRGKTLKKLNRAGKAKVKLSIAFTPDGGSVATTHKTVMLIKKLKG